MIKIDFRNTLFYPGSFYDFTAMEYFMESSPINTFFYCDYQNLHINEHSIMESFRTQLQNRFDIEFIAEIKPEYFGIDNWQEFYHPDSTSFGGDLDHSFIKLFRVNTRVGLFKKFYLFYFGTEAIATYHILLRNRIRMKIMVTQDHGLGGLWTTFCRGSHLESLSRTYRAMPQFLMVGETHEPWQGYAQYCLPFGSFGMHNHQRILYKKGFGENPYLVHRNEAPVLW